MSKYDAEWLLTYIGGPGLILLALTTVMCAWHMTIRVVELALAMGQSEYSAHIEASAGMLFGFYCAAVMIAYGLYVIIEGRKTLASTNWRAEDFW